MIFQYMKEAQAFSSALTFWYALIAMPYSSTFARRRCPLGERNDLCKAQVAILSDFVSFRNAETHWLPVREAAAFFKLASTVSGTFRLKKRICSRSASILPSSSRIIARW